MRRRLFNRTAAVSLMAAVVCVCLPGCILDHRAASSTNSWFHPPPRQFWGDSTRPADLDRSQIHPVSQAKESEAEERLATQSAVELTEQEASAFTDQGFQRTPGTKPYLVRGVYLNWGTGQFNVHVLSGNDIIVGHFSLGHYAVPMQRRAVVLELEHPPRNIYVTCGMTE